MVEPVPDVKMKISKKPGTSKSKKALSKKEKKKKSLKRRVVAFTT